MSRQKVLKCLFFLGTGLCLLGIFLNKGQNLQRADLPFENLTAQNTYLGPDHPLPGNPQLVRIQIMVYDSPEQGGLQMQQVEFYGQQIPLKPRDIYGFRGEGTFQVKPGTYKLRWTAQRDKFIWPRTLDYEETVTIDPRDQWLQITVKGKDAEIT
jgi:hypothetical protein